MGKAPEPGMAACGTCRGRFRIDEERTDAQLNTPRMNHFAHLYHFWACRGALPNEGGAGSQPATFMDAVQLVDCEVSRLREIAAKRKTKKK